MPGTYAAFCMTENSLDFIKYLTFVKVLAIRKVGNVKLSKHTFQAHHSLRILDLSDNNLDTNIVEFLHPMQSLVKLVLQNTGISEIYPNAFRTLINLKDLQLQRNAILIIKTGGFNGLLSMQVLNLSRLSIHSVQKCAFAGSQYLIQLDLSYNQLSKLTGNTFCGLQSLQALFLQ